MNIINKRNEIDTGSGGTRNTTKIALFSKEIFTKPRCFSGAVKDKRLNGETTKENRHKAGSFTRQGGTRDL
jgi:hypothetical protein